MSRDAAHAVHLLVEMIERASIKSTEKGAPEAKKNQTHEQGDADHPACTDGGSEPFRHPHAETHHHSDPANSRCGCGKAEVNEKRGNPVVAARLGDPRGPEIATSVPALTVES